MSRRVVTRQQTRAAATAAALQRRGSRASEGSRALGSQMRAAVTVAAGVEAGGSLTALDAGVELGVDVLWMPPASRADADDADDMFDRDYLGVLREASLVSTLAGIAGVPTAGRLAAALVLPRDQVAIDDLFVRSSMAQDYISHARVLDARFYPEAAAPGPIVSRLRSFTPVRGLVFGHYGEASADVHALIALAASKLAEMRWQLAGARSFSYGDAGFPRQPVSAENWLGNGTSDGTS